ncbi:MAG: putative PurR-regulated permease PerM [Flammeovirgaceae bacterium]|jgi:AI-2 transport protein TqsA
METDLKVAKNVLVFMCAVLVIYLLSLLSFLLIPLALALFMSMLAQPALAWCEEKGFPYLASVLAISIPSLGALGLSGLLVYKTASELYDEKDSLFTQIHGKMSRIIDWVNESAGLNLTGEDITNKIKPLFSVDWLVDSSSSVANALGDFTGLMFMTILYFLVFLGGISKYENYLRYVEQGSKKGSLVESFEGVKNSVVTYTKVKTLISLATGFGYFLTCWIFGVEFALFWGFLAFILNFIPTFGSVIASVPPLFLGLVQIDSSSELGLMLLCLFVVQIFMGNVIEPKLMGEKLSLNTVTVLVGLVFWGYVWGVTGMILSMPLLVLTKIILSQLDGAQMFVKLMGSTPVESVTKTDVGN